MTAVIQTHTCRHTYQHYVKSNDDQTEGETYRMVFWLQQFLSNLVFHSSGGK